MLERDIHVVEVLRSKLEGWLEWQKVNKMNFILTGEKVQSASKEPFFSNADLKPYWYSYRFHREVPATDNIVFGLEINGENILVTSNGLHYLMRKQGTKVLKGGKTQDVTHHIPKRIDFEDIANYANILPKEKFFGGLSNTKSNIHFDARFKLNGVKNEYCNFFKEFFESIKLCLENYEQTLGETKQVLTQELSKNIISAQGFDAFLGEQEENISRIDIKHLHSFVKLAAFLQTKEKAILDQSSFLIEMSYELQEIPELRQKINSQIELYNSMYLLSLNMVVALTENKSIMFFKIYELFDKHGVFNSEWQNGLTSILKDVNTNVKQVINSINNLEASLSSEIRMLEYSLADKINDLQSSVKESLGGLDAKIGYTNLISTVQLLRNK